VLIAEVPAAPLVFAFPLGPPAIALAGAASPLPEALVEDEHVGATGVDSSDSASIAAGAADANADAADASAGAADANVGAADANAGDANANVGDADANANASCNRDPALPRGGAAVLERIINPVKDSLFEDDAGHDAGVTVRLPERYADATFF